MNRLISLLLLCLLAFQSLDAQSIKELEARKKKALANLEATTRLLEQTQKSKQGSVNKINLLKRDIKERQKLLNTLNNQIDVLEANISVLGDEKSSLEAKLAALKKDYANLVYQSYIQHKHFSPLMFVLSSNNFSQAYRRFRYLQEYADYRKDQAAEIDRLKGQLQQKEQKLMADLNEKEKVLDAKAKETNKLQTQQSKESKMLTELKRKEKNLAAQQKKQQRQANELNARIQRLIAEEIRKDQEKARKSQGGQATESKTSPTYQMSKEEQLVAGNFAKNKGKLPMPVDRGFISGNFGLQPHPVLKHVTQNNKGIYIQAPAGSDARAIFEGVVTQRFMVPGSNSAVIIKHGNYRTVYSNLTEIYVKEGDKVSTKQKIGKIFVDTEDENKTELYLMIYKDTSIENPESWLAR